MSFIKNHKILTSLFLVVLVIVIYSAYTGTLSYPYIMFDRQLESLRSCTFGSQTLTVEKFGFSFGAPEGYCVLPNRIFPLDGSVEIVPKGWYFVFNEYAFGTVAKASQATFLFEPVTPDRDPQFIIQNLEKGSFLNPSDVTSTTTSSGITYILANNAKGTDDQLYDWAFYTHPNNKYFVGIVTRHDADQAVRAYLLNSLTVIR